MEILAKQLDSGIPVPCALTVCTQGVCKHGGGAPMLPGLFTFPKLSLRASADPQGPFRYNSHKCSPRGTAALVLSLCVC